MSSTTSMPVDDTKSRSAYRDPCWRSQLTGRQSPWYTGTPDGSAAGSLRWPMACLWPSVGPRRTAAMSDCSIRGRYEAHSVREREGLPGSAPAPGSRGTAPGASSACRHHRCARGGPATATASRQAAPPRPPSHSAARWPRRRPGSLPRCRSATGRRASGRGDAGRASSRTSTSQPSLAVHRWDPGACVWPASYSLSLSCGDRTGRAWALGRCGTRPDTRASAFCTGRVTPPAPFGGHRR